jgi:hypothetical protein
MIKDLLKEDVNNIFKDYLDENKEEILKIIKEVLSNNISILLANAFKYHFQDVLFGFEQNIVQKIQNI